MLKQIYRELVLIRKELQAIRRNLESSKKPEWAVVREPYSTNYKLVKLQTGFDGSLEAK